MSKPLTPKQIANYKLQSQKIAASNRARALPAGEASFNSFYQNMKSDASTRRNLSFELTKEQVRSLTKQNCTYCGSAPSQVYQANQCNGSYLYNGIDRVDNNIGYIISNVTPCCGTCNGMKHTHSLQDFIHHIKRILEHMTHD